MSVLCLLNLMLTFPWHFDCVCVTLDKKYKPVLQVALGADT